MTSQRFYAGLPVITDFDAMTRGESYTQLLEDTRAALDPDAGRAADMYQALIAKVREIYGGDDTCHPLAVPDLAITLSGSRLGNEVGIRAAGRGPLGKWLSLMRTRCIVLLGWFFMKFGIRTGETDWGRYKETLVRNSDVRKFVDVYRQIPAGNEAQRTALNAWLEERYAHRPWRRMPGPRARASR